jgi:hypothetical protein
MKRLYFANTINISTGEMVFSSTISSSKACASFIFWCLLGVLAATPIGVAVFSH